MKDVSTVPVNVMGECDPNISASACNDQSSNPALTTTGSNLGPVSTFESSNSLGDSPDLNSDAPRVENRSPKHTSSGSAGEILGTVSSAAADAGIDPDSISSLVPSDDSDDNPVSGLLDSSGFRRRAHQEKAKAHNPSTGSNSGSTAGDLRGGKHQPAHSHKPSSKNKGKPNSATNSPESMHSQSMTEGHGSDSKEKNTKKTGDARDVD